MDFNKYDDALKVKDYDGFIDKQGNFYKVALRRNKNNINNHDTWAEKFLKDYINISNLNLDLNYPTIFKLVELKGPSEVLINCLGYVYYSHDPILYKPIIKLPNPKIFGYKATEEQLDMLYNIMLLNKEDINIPIFYDEDDEYDYCGLDENNYKRR